MKINRIFWGTVSLTAVLFVVSLYYSDTYHKEYQQKEVVKHATIISNSLWSFNPEIAKDYLQLACEVNKYKKLVVSYPSNETFISIDHSLENPVDLFFESLSLISIQPIKAEIHHKGIVIGEISVQWVNTAIYTYLAEFFIILLLLTVFWLFLATLKHKYELEDRVRERTLDLKKEIEERKLAEKGIKENQEKFRKLLEGIPLPMCHSNQEGVITFLNERFIRMFGYSRKDIPTLTAWRQKAYPDLEYREWVVKKWESAVSRAAQTGTDIQPEVYHVTCKDGTIRELIISGTMINDSPLAIFVDVTDRIRAKKRLLRSQELLNQTGKMAKIGGWELDLLTLGSYFTDEMYVIYELPVGRELNFENGLKVYPPEVVLAFKKALVETTEKNIPFDLETPLITTKGNTKWVRVQWRTEHIKGKAVRLVGTLQDITERKQAEEKVLQLLAEATESRRTLLSVLEDQRRTENKIHKLNAELEQRVIARTAELETANKELEAFSYSVSHDLRAPLRAVDGYTRMLTEDYGTILDDEGLRICSVISKGARDMGQLIDDLLSFSRFGRAAIVPAVIDMKSMARAIFFEQTTPEERNRVKFILQPLPEIAGDPSLMRQVWVNLLSNAHKFSLKKEHALIEVSAVQQDDEIIYCVRDNGAGFDMRYANKLFGIFQRLHSTKEFAGTGVGLAIVQRIISRHGGRVWAEAEVDKGASFYFALKGVTERG
ncbi:MAG: ATP-binding protein [Desulfoplanes sp.]|nr:ATP-binding protein [Desulfoplanes sp.]